MADRRAARHPACAGGEPVRRARRVGLAAIDLADPLAGRWVRYWPNPYHKMQKKAPLHANAAGHAASARVDTAAEYENLRLAYVGWTRARDWVVLASRSNRPAGAMLQRLGSPDKPLTMPAIEEGVEFVDLDWASEPVKARVRRCAPEGPRARAVGAETEFVATGHREFPPRWLQPSAKGGANGTDVDAPSTESTETLAPNGTAAAAAFESIGTRIALSGSPSMDLVGSAVHGFLAADRPELDPGTRSAIAAGLCERWNVANALAPAALLTASDALRT